MVKTLNMNCPTRKKVIGTTQRFRLMKSLLRLKRNPKRLEKKRNHN
jgi:hypothetical protein